MGGLGVEKQGVKVLEGGGGERLETTSSHFFIRLFAMHSTRSCFILSSPLRDAMLL